MTKRKSSTGYRCAVCNYTINRNDDGRWVHSRTSPKCDSNALRGNMLQLPDSWRKEG